MIFEPEFNLKSVLNTDSFDRLMYKELRSKSKSIKEAEKEGSQYLTTFPHLLGDIWAGLFKNTPMLTDEFPKGVELNNTIMEQILKNPEFQALREHTKLDEMASALGALQLNEELFEIIQNNENLKKYQEQQQKLEQMKEVLEKNLGKDNKSELSKEQQEQLSNIEKDLNQTLEEIRQELNGSQRKLLNQAIKNAGEKTKEIKKEVDIFLVSMGYGTNPGEKQKVPAKDRLKLAEILKENAKLKNIAKHLGNMQQLAIKKQKKKSGDSVIRSDVGLGNELSAILPSELALLKNPITRKDFYKRFARQELLQYKPKSKEKLGKGPIVCCIDTSGSMTDMDNQAKAFMLALLMIARRQKRAFACVNYAHATNIKTWVFESKQRVSPVELTEMAEFFWGGGTDFQNPLQTAMKIINSPHSAFKKADIVFITDGGAYVDSKWLEKFNKQKFIKGISVISIRIGNYNNLETLEKFSDKVVSTNDLYSEDATNTAFAI